MDALKLSELGLTLKEHRERNGLLREDLAVRIKISPKNLYAIEEALVDQLPQAVFTRSFIRSYAEAMKMDLAEIDRRLAETFPPETINNIHPQLTATAREQSVIINSPLPGKKILPAAAFIILLLLAGLGAWFYFTHIRPADDAVQERPGSAQINAAVETQNVSPADAGGNTAEVPAPAGPTASGAIPSGQDSASVALSVAAGQPASGPDPQTADPAETAPPAAETALSAGTSGAGASPPNPSSSLPRGEYAHRIMVSAVSGNCWIDVKFDNNSRSVELQSGRTFVWDFQERATVLLGNAAAVKLFYDGKEIMFRAAEGEVKSFRFP
jgi:cytoskeleton protein RodZ